MAQVVEPAPSRPRIKELARLARNAFSLTAANVVTRLINLGFVAVAVRRLGVDSYGLYATALTFLFFAQIFCRLGFQRVIVRDVAQRKNLANHYMSSAVSLSLPLALVIGVALPFLSSALGYGQELQFLLALVGAALVGYALAWPAGGVMQAFERMTTYSALNVAVSLGTAAGGVLLLLLGFGVRALMLLQAISVWVEAALKLIVTHRYITPLRWQPSPNTIRWLIGDGAFFSVLMVFNLLLNRSDVLLLARFSGSRAVGLYVPGVRILEYLAIFRSGAMGALLPFLAARWRQSPETLGRAYGQVLRFFAMYGVGTAVVLTFGAEPVFGLLFGPDYLPGAVVLQLLAWAMVADVLSGPVGTVITISRQRLAQFVPVAGGLALLDVLLTVWLAPRWAHVGAAVASIATALLGLAVRTWWIRNIFGSERPSLLALIWRPVLAGLAMAAVFALLGGLGFWVALVPAALIYLATLVITGAFRPEELARIKQVLVRPSRTKQEHKR